MGVYLCFFLSLVKNMSQTNDHLQPIRVYLKVWALLFILSAASYMVDYIQLQGYVRWSLIIIFMTLKAGLIVSFFMHMAWERLAFMYTIMLPPLLLLTFIGIAAIESDYTFLIRSIFFQIN
ncbi:MAG: cytochrome c oxidase subunit 4 [Francisellaceae bacterium]|jgi:cytochrome c oxidase subunit 4